MEYERMVLKIDHGVEKRLGYIWYIFHDLQNYPVYTWLDWLNRKANTNILKHVAM